MIDNLYGWMATWLPRRLVYWCFVRVIATASVTTYRNKHVGSITAEEAAESFVTWIG